MNIPKKELKKQVSERWPIPFWYKNFQFPSHLLNELHETEIANHENNPVINIALSGSM